MNMREIGRERGRKAAAAARRNNLPVVMEREIRMNLELFPSLGKGFDLAADLLAYDKRRLQCTPDYTKFPELRGMADRIIGEREGFLEGSSLTETHAAFHYSMWQYIQKYISPRHVARYDLTSAQIQCTNVIFPQGMDGVTISDNRDDVPRLWYQANMESFRIEPPVEGPVHWHQGGVSSAVLLDEEPENIFPYNPLENVPDECLNDIRDLVQFMEERRDFWGPGNQMWIDRNLNAVAVEKANVRVAFRYPTVNGACCITACSYLDPEMNAFKRERMTEAARQKGEAPEKSIDLMFSDGCDLRHQRLWDLVNAEAARPGGATLWGAFECVADTAVPFPARVCLAGEKCDPEREPNANWTLTQYASVITGPNRRAIYRNVKDMTNPRPITEETPQFVLGKDVAMQPEWQQDIDSGRCVLVEE
jgi:hypothetical protein